jgi:hypothetical protein
VRILPVLGRPRVAGRAHRMALAVLALALAGVSAAVVTVDIDRAGAQEAAAPVAVPPAYLPMLIGAASSCRSLSPPRLAGQIMAASGFDPGATGGDGGQGVAGLTAATWQRWARSPNAQRSDPNDNIVALAHDMCDLAGQLRAAGVTADEWWAALAAFHSGIAAVVAAGGVPATASDYVGRVTGYADWYAGRPEFVVPPRSAAASGTGPPVQPSPVPAAPSIAPTPVAGTPGKTAPSAPPTARVPAPPADLAAGRPMTSSGFTDVYPEKNANDGDPDTYWESANNAFPQWLQVDLGRPSTVSRFLLRVPPGPLWLQRTQTIQITGSMDGSNYFVILGPAGYSFDPVNANAVQVRFTQTTARYLRLTFTANTDWPAGQLSQWQVHAS